MFRDANTRKHLYPHYDVRLDVAPSNTEADIDLVGERSIDWNARTLALMARGGLINLRGVPDQLPESEGQIFHPYQDIEIRDDTHLNRDTWDAKIEPKRSEIAAANRASLSLMKRFLGAADCPARIVAELYKGTGRAVALTCGGCHLCRRDPNARAPDGIVGEKIPFWPAQAELAPALSGIWGPPKRVLVQYSVGDPDRRTRRDFERAIRRLDLFGLRVFATVGSSPMWIAETVRAAVKDRPWFTLADRDWMPARWPKGARLTTLGHDIALRPEWFSTTEHDDPAIIMAPVDTLDATNPNRKLADVVGCNVLELMRFIEKVLA
jgi:hypothetical protein